jgi:hypothetical protein
LHKAGGGSEGGRYRNRAAVADGRHRKRAVVTGSGRPLQAAVAGSGQPLQATVAGTMPRGKMPQQAGDSDRDGLCVNTHPGEAKCLTPATYREVRCAKTQGASGSCCWCFPGPLWTRAGDIARHTTQEQEGGTRERRKGRRRTTTTRKMRRDLD